MTNYILTVDEWRQATRLNDDGVVVQWKDHKRGAVIDLDEDDTDTVRLVEGGALRKETLDDVPVAEEEDDSASKVIEADEYDDEGVYTYGDLQALAKERDLNAGGSRQDLVARLREYDLANA